jgi:membrane protein
MNFHQLQDKDVSYVGRICLTIFLCLLHVFTVNLPVIAALISVIEFLICLFFLAKKRLEDFLLILMLFSISNFDVSSFVSGNSEFVAYSIFMLPLVKGYPFFILLLTPLLMIYKKDKFRWIKGIKYQSKNLFFFLKFAILMIPIGGITGLFSILINDNDIINTGNIKYFFLDFLKLSIYSLLVIYFSYCIIQKDNYIRFKRMIFSILVGVIFSAFISITIGKRGYYGDEEIVLMPLVFFFSPLIILFFFYKEYRKRSLLFICSVLALWLQFTTSNALGGKSWLALIYIIFSVLLILNQRKKKLILLSIFVLFVPLLLGLGNLLETQKNMDKLSSTKLIQATMLISVFDLDWYENMPLSPKYRIEEFFNITSEYIKKPYYALWGKGFGGSIKDHRNTMGFYNDAAFSPDQYQNGTFILMHEAFNVLFLKFGIWGLFCFFLCIRRGIKCFFLTPWVIVGVLWFFLFWGYSFNLAFFGIPSLVLGFYESNKFCFNEK